MGLMVHDIGSTISVQHAMVVTGWCSSSTMSGTQVQGATIDRLSMARRYQSCKAAVAAFGDLNTATSFANGFTGVVGLQDSPTSTAWFDYSTASWGNGNQTVGSVTPTTSTSTSFRGSFDARFDLTRARRYIRMVATITANGNTSAGGLNVLSSGSAGVLVFGGAEFNPTT